MSFVYTLMQYSIGRRYWLAAQDAGGWLVIVDADQVPAVLREWLAG